MFVARAGAGLLLICFFSSAAIATDCVVPSWPAVDDPAFHAAMKAEPRLRFTSEQKYREQVSTFVRCSRRSLPPRAASLSESKVAELVRESARQEESLIASTGTLRSCMVIYRGEVAAAKAKHDCEEISRIHRSHRYPTSLDDPHVPVAREEFRGFGGLWSYDLVELKPPSCSHGPCGHAFGLSVTNLTPVELMCRVSLAAGEERYGSERSEQWAFVAPGRTVAAARVSTSDLKPTPSGAASCEPKRWPQETLASDRCNVQWIDSPWEYPAGLRYEWLSGAAIVEATVSDRDVPTHLRVVDDGSVDAIGRNATSTIQSLRMYTNCPGARFRFRIEFRTFPCSSCFDAGAIVMIRE